MAHLSSVSCGRSLDMKARMAFYTSGLVMVIQQGREAATDEEWCALLEELAKQDFEKLRVLILTTGGGPTAPQRAQLKTLMAGRSVRTAVVSDSIKARFIIATIALINRQHHGFTSRELTHAFDFLGLTTAERASTKSSLEHMATLIA